MTNNSATRYEFQPPTNMNAIRSTIMQRIIKRNPTVKHDFHLDNGLPSPPIESCTFEDEQNEQKTSEVVHPALLEMSSPTATLPDSPPSPVITTDIESSEAIREKIRLLKQEKHKLFQTMKDLLSQPKKPLKPTSVVSEATSTPPTTSATTAETRSFPIERSRSTSRDNYKARPVIRSRSISHTEFSRPISRYSYHHERRSPPRFYTAKDNRGYINNSRCSFPMQAQSQPTSLSLSSSSSSSSLNMASNQYVLNHTVVLTSLFLFSLVVDLPTTTIITTPCM